MNEQTINQGGKKVKTNKNNKVANLPYSVREGLSYILKYGLESKFDIARKAVSDRHDLDALKIIRSIEDAREFINANV